MPATATMPMGAESATTRAQAGPEFQYNTDVIRLFKSGEHSQQVRGEDRIINNREAGIYGITDGFGGQDNESGADASQLVASTIEEYLASDQFDPDNAEASMQAAFDTAQTALIEQSQQGNIPEDKGVAASFLKFYEHEGKLKAVYGHIGHTVVYAKKRHNELGALNNRDMNEAGQISSGFNGRNDLYEPKVILLEQIDPADRFALVSGGTAGNSLATLLTKAQIESAFRKRSPKTAARTLNNMQQQQVDKSSLVVDVPAVNAPRTLVAPVAWYRGRRETRNNDPTRQSRIRSLGNVALAPIVWYQTRHMPRANGSTAAANPNALTRAEKNRAALKALGVVALTGAGILLGGLGLAYANHHGMDLKFNKDGKMGWLPDFMTDNDNVDVTPWHGASHAVNHDGIRLTATWLDDDPTKPATEAIKLSNGIDPRSYMIPAPAHIAAVQNSAESSQLVGELTVPYNGSVSGTLIHEAVGHPLRGEAVYKGPDAWAAYLKLENELTPTSIRPIGTMDPGLYKMADGHWGFIKPGKFQVTPRIARLIRTIVLKEDLNAQ